MAEADLCHASGRIHRIRRRVQVKIFFLNAGFPGRRIKIFSFQLKMTEQRKNLAVYKYSVLNRVHKQASGRLADLSVKAIGPS